VKFHGFFVIYSRNHSQTMQCWHLWDVFPMDFGSWYCLRSGVPALGSLFLSDWFPSRSPCIGRRQLTALDLYWGADVRNRWPVTLCVEFHTCHYNAYFSTYCSLQWNVRLLCLVRKYEYFGRQVFSQLHRWSRIFFIDPEDGRSIFFYVDIYLLTIQQQISQEGDV